MLTCTPLRYFRHWHNSHDSLLFIFFICILRFVLHLALPHSIPCGVVCSFTSYSRCPFFAFERSNYTICFAAASHATWQYQCLHANLLWAKLRMMVRRRMQRQWDLWRAPGALLPIRHFPNHPTIALDQRQIKEVKSGGHQCPANCKCMHAITEVVLP